MEKKHIFQWTVLGKLHSYMYIMILFPGQWLLLTSNMMVRGKKAGGLGREVVCYCLEQTEEGQFIINLKKKRAFWILTPLISLKKKTFVLIKESFNDL